MEGDGEAERGRGGGGSRGRGRGGGRLGVGCHAQCEKGVARSCRGGGQSEQMGERREPPYAVSAQDVFSLSLSFRSSPSNRSERQRRRR